MDVPQEYSSATSFECDVTDDYFYYYYDDSIEENEGKTEIDADDLGTYCF